MGDANLEEVYKLYFGDVYLFALKLSKNEVIAEDITSVADPFDMEQVFTQSETAAQIYAIVHALNEPYKEVFYLRTFCDLSFQQIGRIFQKSDNWACVTYHRAKAKIQKRMEDDELTFHVKS